MNRTGWLTCLALTLLPLRVVADDVPLRGAGATFPQPVYALWAATYERQGGERVVYDAVGSGAGMAHMLSHEVDFGATDVPLSREVLEREGLLQFPAVVGAVVPVVNIKGIRSGELKLTGELLGEIYLGRITRWDDPALTALNPGLHLPSARITVVHRSEASGTTHRWATYLSNQSALWRERVGTDMTLEWPTGVGGLGNEGVASYVQRTHMAVGYVEHAYALQHHLSTVSLPNRQGRFVSAAYEAYAAADGAGWPLTGPSYIVLRARTPEAGRTQAVLRFFDWAWHQGRDLARGLDYVPLDDGELQAIEQTWHMQVHDLSGDPIWPAAAGSR